MLSSSWMRCMFNSSLAHKEAVILFICDLSGDEWDEEQETEEWTNAIDRGGLWHVSDSTYLIFYLMEKEIRKQLIADNAKTLNTDTKETVRCCAKQ